MKQILVLICTIYTMVVGAQNNALDFIVTTTNDTIYGAIQKDKLIQLKSDETLITHRLDSAITLQKNDVLYQRVTKDYKAEKDIKTAYYTDHFFTVLPTTSDFIVAITNDTIFGNIKTPLFGPKFIKSEIGKTKICKDEALSYRKNNIVYDLKTLSEPLVSKEKKVFLKRLYKGKANLYTYKILRSDVGTVKPKTFYIIEKDQKLHLISSANAKQDLVDLFIDDSKLSDLIFNDFYTVETIYLILKYYDLNQN